MGGINMMKVLVGGVVAGLVMNLGHTVVHVFLFAEASAALMEKLGVTEPVSSQLELKLLPSGALTGAKVTKSTGFNDIDRAIYQAALLASPYPKPPEEYSGRKQFRVELIFAPERL